MKKFVAALAMGAAMMSGAAFADTMTNTFGNTVVVTYPNGAVARYHFNADNTFAAHGPGESHASGTYTLAGGQLCLTPTGGTQACTPYAGDKNVGDTWTQTGSDGSSITVTLEAGRGAHAH